MKKFVGIIAAILSLMLLFSGCEERTKEGDIRKKYPELSSDTQLVFANKDDVLAMLNHGTGVVFFTWEECPWCRKYIQFVDTVSKDFDIPVLCYDIYEDREGDTDFYKDVVEILSSGLDETGAYDAAGKLRVYVPDVSFVVKGEVIGHDNQSSMLSSDLDIDDYWDELEENGQSRVYNLRKKLCAWGEEVCKALDEIGSRGCSKCSVK